MWEESEEARACDAAVDLCLEQLELLVNLTSDESLVIVALDRLKIRAEAKFFPPNQDDWWLEELESPEPEGPLCNWLWCFAPPETEEEALALVVECAADRSTPVRFAPLPS